jgi:hypothetical protein
VGGSIDRSGIGELEGDEAISDPLAARLDRLTIAAAARHQEHESDRTRPPHRSVLYMNRSPAINSVP